MKIIYVNCGVNNYMKEDHHILYKQLLQLRKESLKKNQACTGFEPLTSASCLCDTGAALYQF